MNKDQVRGKWEELKGKIKKEFGAATGDRKTELKGAVEEKTGSTRQEVGKVVEDVKRDIRAPEQHRPT